MKDFVSQQQQEVEKAIIGGGKYVIDTPYKAHEVIDGTWFRPMSEAQRKAHIKRFNALTLSNTVSKLSFDGGNSLANDKPSSTSLLSITLDTTVQQLQPLSQSIVTGIWTKAHVLVADSNAISNVPGGGSKDKFVLSRSGNVPHLVKCVNRSYQCSDRCMSYKANNICSHTVAAAAKNNDLDSYKLVHQSARQKAS